MAVQLAEHLVGRDPELDTLDRGLAEIADGRAAAVEVTGEPGIGKTRLLAELMARADAKGFLVLSGSASELERDLPFGVFADALDEFVVSIDPRRLEALDDRGRAELAQVFPSLAAYAGDRAPALQDERYRIHRAVRDLLERLSAAKPMVLVLDDLHWADSGSIELLGTLLRRPPAAPVLLAMAARPRQVPERFSAVLERAHRAGTLARIEVAALSREQADELLHGTVSGRAVTTIFEASGGNPLYLEQLARSFAQTETVTHSAAAVSLAGVEVPAAVAASLRQELAELTPDARRVLEGAAAAGDPFEPELAAAAAAVEEATAIEALDELLRRDLIRTTDVPRRFSFRHPLVRRAVYEAIPGGWRLTAHERCADALAARGASAATRAHHVEQAGRHGDPEAIAVLREAGDSLALRAPDGAARWYEAALRLLPETAPVEERIDLLSAVASARAATGRFDDSRAALLEALRLAPADDETLRVRLAVSSAGVEQLLGHHAEARARLERTLDTLADPVSPEAVALMISLALDSFYRPALGGWRPGIEQAIELATNYGDRPLAASALAVAAVLCSYVSEIGDSHAYGTRAAALVDAMPDDELAVHLDGIVQLTAAEAYSERFDESIAHGHRALAVARLTGRGDVVPTLVPSLWTALWMRGRLREGAELLDGAIEGARLSANSQMLVLLIMNRGITAALAGDVDVALALATESWELARDFPGSILDTWTNFALAGANIESGDHARAAEPLLAAGGGEDMEQIPGVWRALTLDWLTRCRLALGHGDEAERSAKAAAVVAESTPLRLGTAWAKRAIAAVALDRGACSSAAEHALSSAAVADEVGAPLEAAFSLGLAGRALAQAGDRSRAADVLERAAGAFDACGAIRYRDDAERELRRLGRHVSRTRRGRSEGVGLESLTERELQVARLVVERKTNPEIAAELFLSLKTVETHMRNIFAKLGVSSRVEVARTMESGAYGGEPVAP
jgi:ATP/maltotriose-dependent transcriptional regulator MalT